MFEPRTLKFLAFAVLAYALLVLPGFIWRPYFDSPAGYLLLIPFFTAHIFHKLGVPGLLEHDGLCGWGWCSPTVFGVLFVAIFWLLVAWGSCWTLAGLTSRFGRKSV